MYFILWIVIILFVPLIIANFLRDRPVLSLVIAAIIMFLTFVFLFTLSDFLSIRLLASLGGDETIGISGLSMIHKGVQTATPIFVLSLPIYLPVLALLQWGIRRYFAKRISKQAPQ